VRKNSINTEKGLYKKEELKKIRAKNTTFLKVLSNTRGAFGFLSLVFGLVMWTKIDTTLADKFDKAPFNYSPSIIAIFYTI